MDLVFLSPIRIGAVIVNGALLVEGSPDQVARDPQVKAVYLGEGQGMRDNNIGGPRPARPGDRNVQSLAVGERPFSSR